MTSAKGLLQQNLPGADNQQASHYPNQFERCDDRALIDEADGLVPQRLLGSDSPIGEAEFSHCGRA
jgi:hypothetical protein